MVPLRLYRAAALLIVCGVVIAALSISDRPAPLPLPPAGEGVSAEAVLNELLTLRASFPAPRPGSRADRELARYLAGQLAAYGFRTQVRTLVGNTVGGEKRLADVIATKAAANGGAPLVIVAHRDTDGGGGSLAATAVLLAVARYLGQVQTGRPLVLASTSGGSGGYAGARALVRLLSANGLTAAQAPAAASQEGELAAPPVAHRPADAVLVIADPLAGPLLENQAQFGPALARTAAAALDQNGLPVRAVPSLPEAFGALALARQPREAQPFAAAGIPAATFGSAGEGGFQLQPQRLAQVADALLATVQALNSARPPSLEPQALAVGEKLLAGWALRLLGGACLLAGWLIGAGLLLTAARRRQPVLRESLRGLALALPAFLAAAALAIGGAAGVGALAAPPAGGGIDLGAGGWLLVCGSGLILVGGLALALLRGRGGRAEAKIGAATLLVVFAATVLWAFQPAASLALCPTALILPLATRPSRRGQRLGLVALGLCFPALLWSLSAASWPTGLLTLPALFATAAVPPLAALCWAVVFGAGVLALSAALPATAQPAGGGAIAREVVASGR